MEEVNDDENVFQIAQDSSQTGNYVDTDCNAEESVAPTALLNDLVNNTNTFYILLSQFPLIFIRNCKCFLCRSCDT